MLLFYTTKYNDTHIIIGVNLDSEVWAGNVYRVWSFD